VSIVIHKSALKTSAQSQVDPQELFAGGGEMGALMRRTDWAATRLGPVDRWSPALRMMVKILLANRFPMLLWWGPDFCQLYNDAYRPILGTKHPQFLGQPVRECWNEIWHILEPLIRTPFEGGPATWMEDILLEINRHGFMEETHFTIAYSPVPDESAPRGIGGVLATVHEISEKVVGERRTMALRDLGAAVLEERSAEEACARAAEILANYPKDIPFSLLYLLDPDRKVAHLAGSSGINADQRISPAFITLQPDDPTVWPLLTTMESGQIELVDDLSKRRIPIPAGPWADPPSCAAVVPIHSNIAHQLAGFMVAGLSSRLKYDDFYRGFLDLTSSQIATAVANARAYQQSQGEMRTALIAAQHLAAIVESSDDAIASKDLNGIVTSWNKSAERLFGYTASEIIGRPITTIIPPELLADETMILGKIRKGEKIDHFETIRVTKSGERVEVSLSISPVRDAAGNIVGAAKVVRDITQNKKIERALRTTEKLAAAGRLAATVAHEINNPLEAVHNLVFLAKRDVTNSERVAEYLQMAQRELDRVAHIARQTLGFYRDTSAPTKFSVVKTLEDLLFLYEKRLEVRGIRVVRQYKYDGEITALAGEVRQVLSNLISNAIDAMPTGGSLCIRISKSHEWNKSLQPGVRITILDSGSGIPLPARKKLFEPFFTTKADVGTGLGLWITKNIVEKHHGSIRFVSRTAPNDHGTAFSIYLPAQSAPENPENRSEVKKPRRLTA
jgi:PAS domain S-box-containing protein